MRAAKESHQAVLNDWRKAGSDLAVERKRAGERDSDMQVSRELWMGLEQTSLLFL